MWGGILEMWNEVTDRSAAIDKVSQSRPRVRDDEKMQYHFSYVYGFMFSFIFEPILFNSRHNASMNLFTGRVVARASGQVTVKIKEIKCEKIVESFIHVHHSLC